METDELRKRCERFRVLIIGKANAGKTTILQKMCGTTENPVIHNQMGEEITLHVTSGRGIHNIEDELTFPNNPGFVFHDSCGFEAGSTEEVENVNAFIAARAATNNLAKQVHIVWICLPVDDSRFLQPAEMAFFEHGTGNVPAVAIFTKFDDLDVVHFKKLRDGGKSRSEAKVEAPKVADIYFNEHLLQKIQSTKYPPAGYVCLRSMHKPETECGELTRKTIEALDNDILQRLFASVQDNNIQLCIEYAISDVIRENREVILRGVDVRNQTMTSLGLRILTWFPHIMKFDEDEEDWRWSEFTDNDDASEIVDNIYADERVDRSRDRDRNSVRSRWEAALDPVIESLVGQPPIAQQLLRLTAAISIIGEHSFQLLKHSKTSDALQGLDSYLKSPQAETVRQAVDDTFPLSVWIKEDEDARTREEPEPEKRKMGGLIFGRRRREKQEQEERRRHEEEERRRHDEEERVRKRELEIKLRLVEIVLANLMPKDYFMSQNPGE